MFELSLFKKKLVVSCQALENEPLYSSFIMGRMAIAAKEGGAAGIRAQGISDIVEIKKNVDLPVIGIIKKNYNDSDVYITPTKKEVLDLIKTDCEIIAIDCTIRKRPNNEKLETLIELIKKNNKFVMADISTIEEGIMAEQLGVDCISTTLSGYTEYTLSDEKPNFDLIKKLVESVKIPVIAEGNIHYPYQLKEAFNCGAFSAVVGGAITRPKEITERFVKVIKDDNIIN